MRTIVTLTLVSLCGATIAIYANTRPTQGIPTSAPLAQSGSYWQVVLEYTDSTMAVRSADPIPKMLKTPSAPGSLNPLVNVPYDLSWLDGSGIAVFTTPITVPLGERAIGAADGACTPSIPSSGVVVLRIPGPAEEDVVSRIRIERTAAPIVNSYRLTVPRIFDRPALESSIPVRPPLHRQQDGPRSSWKPVDNGPDNNRLVLVVLGDGYTAANLDTGLFTDHVNQFITWMPLKEPWDLLWSGSNVYAIEVESVDEGCDQDGNVNGGPPGTFVNNYFNSSYWSYGIERNVSLWDPGPARAVAVCDTYVGPGVWDYAFVLVNATKYGGAAGQFSVVPMSVSAYEVIPHEWGHQFAGLADEYGGSDTGAPSADSEPNVDFDSAGPGLKWLPWVEAGTPLPTPDDVAHDDVIGTFRGGRYYNQGIYRPFRRCLMNYLERPFCSVCQEQNVRKFAFHVNFADSVLNAGNYTINGVGDSVGIIPYDLYDSLEYSWVFRGVPYPDSAKPTFYVNRTDLQGSFNTINLQVTYITPKERLGDITQNYSWILARGACCDVAGDADGSGGFNIADVTFELAYIFGGGTPPECNDETDANGDNTFNIADITYGINYIFASGPPPICGTTGN